MPLTDKNGPFAKAFLFRINKNGSPLSLRGLPLQKVSNNETEF